MVTSLLSPSTIRPPTGEPTLSATGGSNLGKLRPFVAAALVALAACVDEPTLTDPAVMDREGAEPTAAASDQMVDGFRLGEPYDLAGNVETNAEELRRASQQVESQASSRPLFQMPFYYHQTWMASTYNGHYPNQNSIDLRRYSGATNISEGEPVVASAAGTISEVGPVLSPEGDYYGDYIYINHGIWQTRYLHIKKGASWAPGMTIERGQLLGTVGTYLDMAPHLHYTQLILPFGPRGRRVEFNGVPIDVHVWAEKPDGTYPTQNLTSNNAPTGCTVTGNSVQCSAGAAVRAVAECYLPHTGTFFFRQGPWAAAKATSTASCNTGHGVDVSYEVS